MTKPVLISKKRAGNAGWLFRLAAVLLFIHLAVPAQADDRFLLIFNTSSAMKKRLPAVTTLITNFYATAFAGAAQGGDEIGVWTFDEKLHAGDFPLSEWLSEEREQNAVNLVTFISKQKFTGNSSLAALQPAVNRVITNSDRLTILIICDGTGEINWTPYNDTINETLHRTQAERKSSKQPVVLALRTEKGKYIGSALSFPPNGLNFPDFTPRPKPAPAKITTLPPPVAAKPVITAPPLVILGTHVGTNIDELVKEQESRNTNSPAPANDAVPTVTTSLPIPVAEFPATPVQTNAASAVVMPPAPPIPPTTTQSGAVTAVKTADLAALESTERGYRLLVPIAACILGLALILSVVAIVRSRQPRGSLITDSMNAPKGPLEPK